MTQHPTVFTIEKAIPAAEAMPDLVAPGELRVPSPEPTPPPTGAASTASRKRPIRRLLLAGAARRRRGRRRFRLAVLDGRPLRGLDRRRLCQGRQHHDRPQISGYIAAVLVDDNEPVKAGQVLARIDDRDFKVSARAGQGRGRGRQGQHRQQAGGDRGAAVGDRGGAGHGRGRPGQRRPSPSRTTSAMPSWRRRAMAACRTRSRRPRGSPRRAPP